MADDHFRIGDLLLAAGAMPEKLLAERVDLARQVGLPLGQILVQSGDFRRQQLAAALHVQALLIENVVTEQVALESIKRICLKDEELDEALFHAGVNDATTLSCRLGDLIERAELVPEDELTFALVTSGELGIPLGHVLIQMGVLKPEIVGAALAAQKEVRSGSAELEPVIERLRLLARAQGGDK